MIGRPISSQVHLPRSRAALNMEQNLCDLFDYQTVVSELPNQDKPIKVALPVYLEPSTFDYPSSLPDPLDNFKVPDS